MGSLNNVRAVSSSERGGEIVDVSDPPLMNFLNIVNGVTHMFIGAITFVTIYCTMNIKDLYTDAFRQHIYLCVIGYILLMSQSVMTFSPNNGWSLGMDNKAKTVVHWAMQVLGSILAIIGSIIQMVDLESNFTTPHGIIGFVAMIFTVITLISGVRNLLCSNIMNYNYLRLAHSVFGVLTLVAAYTSLCLGFQIFLVWYSESTVNLSIALAVLTLIGVLVGAIGNIIYKKYLEC